MGCVKDMVSVNLSAAIMHGLCDDCNCDSFCVLFMLNGCSHVGKHTLSVSESFLLVNKSYTDWLSDTNRMFQQIVLPP